MATINRGNHPSALWPGIHRWFGMTYGEIAQQWSMCFATQTSDKAYEEQVESTGFGYAPIKSEGGSVSYDTHSQGSTSRYTHATRALGYIVTEEEIDDNKYASVSRNRARALAFSMRQTKEVTGANIVNRGFDAAYPGGDGVPLFSAAHPSLTGGTQSNTAAVAADLSEAALEAMLIQVRNAVNSRGLKIALRPMKLIVPPEVQFEATRILGSVLRVGTDFNDTNAIRNMGLLGTGDIFIWDYLTDTDAWFVKTDAPDSMNMFRRRGLRFKRDNDFDTENAKAKSDERYSFGWSEWRGIYGNPGA